MQQPGLLELNAVVLVSTHRNFRRAAAELGMSPSAFSHAISGLEKRLGVRLINRTTRSVSLSEAGERFLARVRPALHEIASAMEAVNEFRDTPTGSLRITASEKAQRFLSPVLSEFLRRYPDMRLELNTEQRLIDIVAEGFDAGISIAESVPHDLISMPCSPQMRFVVVGSPDYFKSPPRPKQPSDLLAHDCIRRRMGSGKIYRWEFERRGEEFALDVPGRLTLDDDGMMVRAALDGMGLAYVTDWRVAEHIAANRLAMVLEEWTPPFPGLRLYYPANRHAPAGLRAFVDLLWEMNAEPVRTRRKRSAAEAPSPAQKPLLYGPPSDARPS